jgi:hypothetical protein
MIWVIINGVFSARLQIQTWKNLKTAKKLIKCSSLIITCQPRVGVPITSKENGVSSAESTVLFLIGLGWPIPWPRRSLDVTCGDI